MQILELIRLSNKIHSCCGCGWIFQCKLGGKIAQNVDWFFIVIETFRKKTWKSFIISVVNSSRSHVIVAVAVLSVLAVF